MVQLREVGKAHLLSPASSQLEIMWKNKCCFQVCSWPCYSRALSFWCSTVKHRSQPPVSLTWFFSNALGLSLQVVWFQMNICVVVPEQSASVCPGPHSLHARPTGRATPTRARPVTRWHSSSSIKRCENCIT